MKTVIEISDSKDNRVKVRLTCDVKDPDAWLANPVSLTLAQRVTAVAIEAITRFIADELPKGSSIR